MLSVQQKVAKPNHKGTAQTAKCGGRQTAAVNSGLQNKNRMRREVVAPAA